MMEMVFQQANESLKNFSIEDKEALVYNIAESLMFIPENIQQNTIKYLKLINEELGMTIEKQL